MHYDTRTILVYHVSHMMDGWRPPQLVSRVSKSWALGRGSTGRGFVARWQLLLGEARISGTRDKHEHISI